MNLKISVIEIKPFSNSLYGSFYSLLSEGQNVQNDALLNESSVKRTGKKFVPTVTADQVRGMNTAYLLA